MRDIDKLEGIDKRYRIFGMIFLLSTKLETLGNNFLEELTTKQWFLMLVLANFFDKPPTLTELASKMGTSRQNVRQLSIKLEKKGFLSVVGDEEDNRILRIVLTDKINDYVKLREKKDHEFIDEFFKVLTNSEIQGLDYTILKLMVNLQNMEENLS